MPNPHRRTNLERPQLGRQNIAALDAMTPSEMRGAGIFPPSYQSRLPFEWKDTIRILGVMFGPLLSFETHIETLLCRARARHGVITSLAHSNWGLETGIMRTTHNALLVSLTRYGMVTYWASAYEAGLQALDTKHTNPAVRRVLGVGPTAMLETLFTTADLISARNLFLQSCAAVLDRSLRAPDCVLSERMERRTARVYNVDSWATNPVRLTLSSLVYPRTWEWKEEDRIVQETWLCNLLNGGPALPDRSRVTSAFFTNAPEITSNPLLREQTYNFRGCHSRHDVGLRILAAAGWRPDCARATRLNAEESLPPLPKGNAWIAVGAIGAMDWRNGPMQAEQNTTYVPETMVVIDVEVMTSTYHGFGISCSYCRTPDNNITCQGWVMGWDPAPVCPAFTREFTILHGCCLILQTLQDEGELQPRPTAIHLRAGDEMACSKLYRWLNEGCNAFVSVAGAAIIFALHSLAAILPCPLLIFNTEQDHYTNCGEWDTEGEPAGFVGLKCG